VTLTPQERANIERRPTANATAFLAYSRGLRDEAFGQYASAAANYRAAVAADPAFNAARTRLTGAQTSQARATGSATTVDAGDTKSEAKSDAPASSTSAASALAGGAINPSPVGTLTTTGSAGTTQQQTSQQDRGQQATRQPVFTTVVIIIKQLP
jgi:hypothetical protein